MKVVPSIDDLSGCLVNFEFKYTDSSGITTEVNLKDKEWKEVQPVVESLLDRFKDDNVALNGIGYHDGKDVRIGSGGFSSRNVSCSHSIFKKIIDTGEKMRCGRRYELGPGLLTIAGEYDTWQKVGEDRVCSYCGSLHPEDFEKIIDLAIVSKGKEAEVEATTKGYKFYARRKGVLNAGLGGIKFYTQHVYNTMPEADRQAYVDRLNPKIGQAIQASKG